jgi:serine protease AprX
VPLDASDGYKMNYRFLRGVLFALGLVLATVVPFPGPTASLPGSPESKVDPLVMQQVMTGEPAEFILVLAEQADLSLAGSLPTKSEKGRYVVETLTAVADHTQGAVIQALVEQGAQYRAYWVANMIWVRAGLDTLQSMAARADIAHVHANPRVRFQEPVRSRTMDTVATVDGVEWNISKVKAPDVWAVGHTGQGVVVGGQDTGYQWDHPALKNQYRGWDGAAVNHDYHWHDAIHTGSEPCGADSPAPCDTYGHGTHTMGTMVGSDGGANQIGMAPDARWIGCRNMDNQGYGSPTTYSECYQWFMAPTKIDGSFPDPSMAPDVINNSWSCTSTEGCTLPNVLLTVVDNVRAAGIVTVHSAGNSGSSCGSVNTPAAIYASSFTVGSTDSNDVIATTSSRGPVAVDGSNRRKPDVAAPGVNIRSSVPGSQYAGGWSGTSMAAPHVAGLVALLIGANPTLAGQVEVLENTIEQSAVPRTTTQGCGGDSDAMVPNNVYGWGRIDALAAYQSLQATGSLRVVLEPQEAVDAGAAWRVDGGDWRPSGDTVANLAVGQHPLDFATVNGCAAPSSQSVTVAGGKLTEAGGTYQCQAGSLVVTILPQRAADAGARWNLDGGVWQISGATLAGLDAGQHAVGFKTVKGWVAPPAQSVTIAEDQTTTTARTYTPLPIVSVVASDPRAREKSNDYGRFKISRKGDRSKSLVVQYTLGGTAMNGKDYRRLPGKLTIPHGKSSGTITVVPVDNHFKEKTQSVVLQISSMATYVLGSPRKAAVVINDPN